MWINSSLEIKCSTSLENLSGLSLKRRFLGDELILYLNFDKGVVTKNTTMDKFQNRISMSKEQLDPGARYTFKLQLSLLGLEDTDLYYCSWAYIDEQYNNVNLESNGTVVIVRGEREMLLTHIRRIAALHVYSLSTLTCLVVEMYDAKNLGLKCPTYFFTEGRPAKECSVRTVDLTLICLSIAAFTGVFLMIIGLMIVRCRRVRATCTG